MKKRLAFWMACAMAAALLTGCAKASPAPEDNAQKLRIVTAAFPEYDWMRQIVRGNENVELTMLLDNGVDLHSFQPTVADMVKISTCDVFVHVGGESDSWVDDAMKTAVNPDMVVIDLLEVLGDAVKEEEIVEGMEHDDHDEEDHDDHGAEDHDDHDAEDHDDHGVEDHDDHDAEDHDDHGVEDHDDHDAEDHDEHDAEDHDDHDEDAHDHHAADEHVWLSLRHAKTLCRAFSEALCRIDADNAALYQANTEAYLAELDALDSRYQQELAGAAGNTLLFGDRFPFRYLVDDYGLKYYAAFSGCAAETEASFETVVFLAQKMDEMGLNAVLTLEGSNQALASTVLSNTAAKDARILSVDSMQSVTAKDAAGGASYLSIMEKNLEVLKAALA